MNSQQPSVQGTSDIHVSMLTSSMPSASRYTRGTHDATEGFSSFLDRFSGERGSDGARQQKHAAGSDSLASGDIAPEKDLKREGPVGSEESLQDLEPESGNPELDSEAGLSTQLSQAVTTAAGDDESDVSASKDLHLSSESSERVSEAHSKEVNGLENLDDATRNGKSAFGKAVANQEDSSNQVNPAKDPPNPDLVLSDRRHRVLVGPVSQTKSTVSDPVRPLKGAETAGNSASNKNTKSLHSKHSDRNLVHLEDVNRAKADKSAIGKQVVDSKEESGPAGQSKSIPMSPDQKHGIAVSTVVSGKPAVQITDKSKSGSEEKSGGASSAAAGVSRYGNKIVSEAKPAVKVRDSIPDQKPSQSANSNERHGASEVLRRNGEEWGNAMGLQRVRSSTGKVSGVVNAVQNKGTETTNATKDAVLSGLNPAKEGAANTAQLSGKKALQPIVPVVNNSQTLVNEAVVKGLNSRLTADGTQDALDSFSMIATSIREVPNPTKGSLFSQGSRLDGSEPFLSLNRGSWSGDSSSGRNDGSESGGSQAETGSNPRDSMSSAYREVAKGASSVDATDTRPQLASQTTVAASERVAASQVSVQIVNQIVEHLERMRQTERNHVRVVLGDEGKSRLTAEIRMVGGKIHASFEGSADAMAQIRIEWDLIRDHARELGVALDEPEYLSDPWSGEDSVLFPVSGPSGDENPNVIQHNNQSVRPAYKTAATGSSGPVHLYA